MLVSRAKLYYYHKRTGRRERSTGDDNDDVDVTFMIEINLHTNMVLLSRFSKVSIDLLNVESNQLKILYYLIYGVSWVRRSNELWANERAERVI